jgi:CDP-diglyceride synthetase
MNGGFYAASVFLVVLIWTQDTAAYAMGMRLRKTPSGAGHQSQKIMGRRGGRALWGAF